VHMASGVQGSWVQGSRVGSRFKGSGFGSRFGFRVLAWDG
jgi:hypothetical protein